MDIDDGAGRVASGWAVRVRVVAAALAVLVVASCASGNDPSGNDASGGESVARSESPGAPAITGVDPGAVSEAMLLSSEDVASGAEEVELGPGVVYGDSSSYTGERGAFFGDAPAWERRLDAGGGGPAGPSYGGAATEVYFLDESGADVSESAAAFGHVAYRLAGPRNDVGSGRFLVQYVWIFESDAAASALVDNFSESFDGEFPESAVHAFFGSLWDFGGGVEQAGIGDRSVAGSAVIEQDDLHLELVLVAEANAVTVVADIASGAFQAQGADLDLEEIGERALANLAG